MEHSPVAVAEAFSSHRFASAAPYLAESISWDLVGGQVIEGKAAVTALCEASELSLTSITTRFRAFRVIEAEGTVVVDSVAEYTDEAGEVSVVSSCDLYDFDDGVVVRIRSYAVEL